MAQLVLLMGPTGAGKSEVAGRLVEARGFIHLSSGRILREHLSQHPQMKQGKLVPAAEVEHIIDASIIAALESVDDSSDAVILLDGFPRTLEQARWLESRMAGWGTTLWRVIHLDIDLVTSQRRLSGRGRSDDAPDSIVRKWQEYELSTRPLIEWYEAKGVLDHIDAAGRPDAVYNLVIQELSR